MGYYCKRYITLIDGGQSKLQELKSLITSDNEYDWDNIVKLVNVGILSDCDNNLGGGTKWYEFENDITKASERLGNTTIYVLEITEDNNLVEYYLTDGMVQRSYIKNDSLDFYSDVTQVSRFIDNHLKRICDYDRYTKQD